MTLASCVIGLTFSVAPMFIGSTSVLLIPIIADTGWSRSDLSNVLTVGLLCMAFGAAIAGRLITRFGARPVIVVCTLGFAGALLGMSAISSVKWGLLCACVAGLCGMGAAQAGYLTVLPLWFSRRLGTALAIAMLGSGAGNSLMPIVVEHLARHMSWRQTYQVLAGMVLAAALPSSIFLLRTPPRSLTMSQSTASQGLTTREALRTIDFWLLVSALFLASTVTTAVGVYLVPMLMDRGYQPARAAQLFSLFGIALLIGRFGSGLLFDYFSARWVAVACLAAACGGVIILQLDTNSALCALAIAMVAMAHGMEGDLAPYLAQRHFGTREYGTIYGLLGLVIGLGTVAGSLLMSAAHRLTGSYNAMLFGSVPIFALAVLALIRLRPKPGPRLNPDFAPTAPATRR
jgi:OFA family oxalate/formate antiporter-like MFS transporter